MLTITLPNNWQPRPHQLPLWNYMECGGKRASEIAHRRWGKDDVALHWTATSAHEKIATYWHMLPEYSQARKAIWNAINPHTGIRRIDEAFPLELRSSTNDHEMFIRFKSGSTWQVVGSDNYKSLVGTPPYGLVFSEWAKANPSAWAYLSPILAENGGWAMFITTPEGKNHAYALHQMARNNLEWFTEISTVENTGFPLSRVEEARKEYHALYGKEAGDALIEQEYYCSFTAAILGAVYGKWMAKAEKTGRIRLDIYDPTLPVHTAWDLGFDDSTSIWFYQQTGKEIRLIDYYEMNGQDICHYCEQLYGHKIIVDERDARTGKVLKWHKDEAIEEAAHRSAYKYGKHYVPHDAANELLAAGGRSTVQQAHEYGVVMYVVPATSQQNGIEAARKLIDYCWFDETRCAKGIAALQGYQFEYDDDKKTFKSTPRHDWSSHACDALEIIGQIWKNPVSIDDKPKPKFLHDLTAKDVFWPNTPSSRPRERI